MQNLKSLLFFLIFTFFVIPINLTIAKESKDYDKSVVLVAVKDEEKLKSEYKVKNYLLSNIYSVYVPEGKTVEEFIKELKGKDYVEFAQPNYLYKVYAVPNDEFVSYQWNLSKIQAFDAWDITTGSSDVVIGIIDTGVDYTHPDLQGNIWVNTDEICNNGLDDDNNGYIDDCHGWDADKEIGDEYRDTHGTHVAGIIAATSNNGIGIAGLGWNLKILSCNASLENNIFSGALTDENIAQCFAYMLKQKFLKGVNIVAINGSFGGYNYSKAAEKFLQVLDKFGIIFVVSAGNEHINVDEYPSYPCAYRVDNVICVGATDNLDKAPYFSNYGFNTVDIFAPGVNILSTIPTDYYNYQLDRYGYAFYNGTSMAAPHVTAAIGLLKSIEPDLTSKEIKERLIATSDTVSTLFDKNISCGRLNLYKFLTNQSEAKFCMNIDPASEYTFYTYQNEDVAIEKGIIRNTGNQPLRVNSVSLSDPQYFSILDDECTNKELNFLEECRITIAYVPPYILSTIENDVKSKLLINANGNTYEFNLKGYLENRPYNNLIDISKQYVLFRNVSVGSSKSYNLRIKNISDDDIKISIRKGYNPNFDISTDIENPCHDNKILKEDEYCYLKVIYSPKEEGTHSSLLSILVRDPDEENFNESIISTANVSIKGTTQPSPELAIEPDQREIKIVKDKDSSVYKTVKIINKGADDLLIKDIEVVKGSLGMDLEDSSEPNACTNFTVLSPNDYCTLKFRFFGDEKDYNYTMIAKIESNDPLQKKTFLVVKGIIDKVKIKLEPSKVKFANVMIGQEKTHIVKIKNTSKENPVIITDISLEQNSEFEIDTFEGEKPCGTIPIEIPEYDYCTIAITYRPQTTGKKKANLYVKSGKKGKKISIEGIGTEPIYPEIDISPVDYNFGQVIVGQNKKATFTIKNTGFSQLNIKKLEVKSKVFTLDFNDGTSPCGNTPISLLPGNECTFSITFSPEKDKEYKSTIKIESNSLEKKKEINLYGKGRYQSPIITVEPKEYDFQDVLIGTSKEKTFTISNDGDRDLVIEEFKYKNSDFHIIGNNCQPPMTLSPGEECSFKVSFIPLKTKRQKASIEIKSNDPENKKVKIQLYGRGVYQSSILTIFPDDTVIDFGKIKVNQQKKQIIKLENKGNINVNIYEIKFKENDNFSININGGDKPCSRFEDITIPPGDYCTFEITFTPDDTDKFRGKLELKTSDPNKKKIKISLLGFGRPDATPALTITPREINMDILSDEVCDILSSVIITNDGEDTLTFNIDREKEKRFSFSTTCAFNIGGGYVVDPGESCYITVKIKECFRKNLEGKTVKGKLKLNNINDPVEEEVEIPIRINIKKKENTSPLSLSKVEYPHEAYVYIGEVSFPYVIEVINQVNSIINVSDVYITNNTDFDLKFDIDTPIAAYIDKTKSCKSKNFTLYPQDSCYLYVFFKPKSKGLKKTKLIVQDDYGNIESYTIKANALSSKHIYAMVDPIILDEFEFIQPGYESDIKEVKIRNFYEIPVEIKNISLQNDSENSFEMIDNFGDKPCRNTTQIEPKDYCTIGIKFKPQSFGIKKAKIKVSFKDIDIPEIEGEVIGRSTAENQPHIVISPRQILVGLLYPESISEPYEIKIRNIGTDTLSVSNIIPQDEDILVVNYGYGDRPCGSSSFDLSPGDYCTVGILYNPKNNNDDVVSLIIQSNDTVFPVAKIKVIGDPSIRENMFTGEGCSFGKTTAPLWLISLLIPVLIRKIRKKY